MSNVHPLFLGDEDPLVEYPAIRWQSILEQVSSGWGGIMPTRGEATHVRVSPTPGVTDRPSVTVDAGVFLLRKTPHTYLCRVPRTRLDLDPLPSGSVRIVSIFAAVYNDAVDGSGKDGVEIIAKYSPIDSGPIPFEAAGEVRLADMFQFYTIPQIRSQDIAQNQKMSSGPLVPERRTTLQGPGIALDTTDAPCAWNLHAYRRLIGTSTATAPRVTGPKSSKVPGKSSVAVLRYTGSHVNYSFLPYSPTGRYVISVAATVAVTGQHQYIPTVPTARVDIRTSYDGTVISGTEHHGKPVTNKDLDTFMVHETVEVSTPTRVYWDLVVSSGVGGLEAKEPRGWMRITAVD